MKQKNKSNQKTIMNLFLVGFLALLMVGFVNAGGDIDFYPDDNHSLSLYHGSGFSFNFDVSNNNQTYDLNTTVKSINNFSGQPGFTVDVPNIIENNTNGTATVNINVPRYTDADNYTGDFQVGGTLNNSGETGIKEDTFTIDLKVLTQSAMELSKLNNMSLEQDEGVLNITNKGNTDFLDINISSEGDFNASFSDNNFGLAAGNSEGVGIQRTTSNEGLPEGNNEITVTVNATGDGGSLEKEITFSADKTKELTISETNNKLTKDSNGTIKVENTGTVDASNINLNVVKSGDFSVSFGSSGFDLAAGESNNVAINSNDAEKLSFGDDNTVEIRATSDNFNGSKKTIKVPLSFCEDTENPGDLNIDDLEFSVEKGFGDEDEDFWYPADEIEAKFDLENNGDYDVENIEIKACLLDTESGDCIMDEDDMELIDDDFDVDEGDDTSITLTFNVSTDDLEGGNEDHEFHVKANGNIDDSDAPEDLDGNDTCTSDSQSTEIVQEEFIIINNFVHPEKAQCEAEFEVFADVWNIDDGDIDEDDVFLVLRNEELDIDKEIHVSDEIDGLDYEEINFDLKIPEKVEEGFYEFTITAYDDEDMNDDDIYENGENDEAEYSFQINVSGNCKVEAPTEASVSADSDDAIKEGGKQGEEMVVEFTLENNGENAANYSVSVTDFTSWASSASLSEGGVIELAPGESKDINATLDVNKGVSGSKEFTIQTFSDGKVVNEQPITVPIVGSDFIDSMKENWFLWTLGIAVFVLLIIVIIVGIRTKSSK